MILYERRETVRTPDARSGVEANAERRPCGNLFALAVDRKFNREEADFIPVTTWRKTAEFVAKYFRKGQRVIIASGRIKVDPYTDKDGNKRTHFEVVADEVEFAESRRAAEDPPGREPGRRLHGERELRRD